MSKNETPSLEAQARRLPVGRFVVVALLVALDLWSKSGVFAYLADRPEALVRDAHGHERVTLLGNFLAVMRSWNSGMAFGLASDFQPVLVVGRIIAVFVLAWLLFKQKRICSAGGAALVLVTAGAMGNLYDNLFLGTVGQWFKGEAELSFGAVRDFIDVYFGVWDWHFATFNVADSCISVGAVLLILFWAKDEKQAKAADAAEE